MKRLVVAAALAGALAACGDVAEEADDPAAEAVAAAEAVESSAGSWDVTTSDGTRFIAALNPDGTYQYTDAAGMVTESGTWEDRADGNTCFDSEGGDDTVVCFSGGEAQEDGSMVVTPDDDTGALTIKRIG